MRLALLLLAVLTVGCSATADGPPEIQVDRTACAHCTMLVSEARYAAAFERGGEARVFDDIGCLLDALQREPNVAELRFWFHDMASGTWMRGEDAVFVKSARFKTPMSGGIVAYRQRPAEGELIGSLRELLEMKR